MRISTELALQSFYPPDSWFNLAVQKETNSFIAGNSK